MTIRYAETDADVVLIHRFLCIVAGPQLPAKIDPKKSIEEVWRVVSDDVALMAITDSAIIGTIGLVKAEHWWGDLGFLANRWFFAIPGSGAWRPLLREAKAIAKASELELHIISEDRGKIAIFNRTKRHVLRESATNRLHHVHPAGVAH